MIRSIGFNEYSRVTLLTAATRKGHQRLKATHSRVTFRYKDKKHTQPARTHHDYFFFFFLLLLICTHISTQSDNNTLKHPATSCYTNLFLILSNNSSLSTSVGACTSHHGKWNINEEDIVHVYAYP